MSHCGSNVNARLCSHVVPGSHHVTSDRPEHDECDRRLDNRDRQLLPARPSHAAYLFLQFNMHRTKLPA